MTHTPRSKYGVRNDAAGREARTVDGILFASQREAKRYWELRRLEESGEIAGLKRQPQYELEVNEVMICRYRADFKYLDKRTKKEVVEDSKGYRTQEYKIKQRLMLACHGIEIQEV